MSRRITLGTSGLTPLLDTLFLVIFALLALTQSRTAGRNDTIRVELPAVEAGADQPSADLQTVQVFVDAEGSVTVRDGAPPMAGLGELDAALSAVLGDAVPESVRVEIVADERAPYGVAVMLLQHLRLAGFLHVGLLARQKTRPPLHREEAHR